MTRGKRRSSHPSRVRGLKQASYTLGLAEQSSHPSRVRGLKPLYSVAVDTIDRFAPITGAWIETYRSLRPLALPVRTHHGCVD